MLSIDPTFVDQSCLYVKPPEIALRVWNISDFFAHFPTEENDAKLRTTTTLPGVVARAHASGSLVQDLWRNSADSSGSPDPPMWISIGWPGRVVKVRVLIIRIRFWGLLIITKHNIPQKPILIIEAPNIEPYYRSL